MLMAWNLLISLIINEILENHLPAPNQLRTKRAISLPRG